MKNITQNHVDLSGWLVVYESLNFLDLKIALPVGPFLVLIVLGQKVNQPLWKLDLFLNFISWIPQEVKIVDSYQDNHDNCDSWVFVGETVELALKFVIDYLCHVLDDRKNELVLKNDQVIEFLWKSTSLRSFIKLDQRVGKVVKSFWQSHRKGSLIKAFTECGLLCGENSMIADVIHEHIKVVFCNMRGKFLLILEKHLINLLVSADVIFTVRDFVFFGVFNEAVHQLHTGLGDDLVDFFVDAWLVLDVHVLVVKFN